MRKKSFRRAARQHTAAPTFVEKYGVNMASSFWGVGYGFQVASVFLGGTNNEMIAGIANLGSIVPGLLGGSWRYGFATTLTLNAFAKLLYQGPQLLSSDPFAWVGQGLLLVSCLPVVAEPWVQKWASSRVREFKVTGQNLLSWSKGQSARLLLKVAAKPRVTYCALNTLGLALMAYHDYKLKRFHALPVYLSWFAGDLITPFSKSEAQLEERYGAAALPLRKPSPPDKKSRWGLWPQRLVESFRKT